MMLAPNLPPDVLVQLLAHVDQQHRLRSCALVCRAWHAASNAATTDIIYSIAPSVTISEHKQAVTDLGAWISKYGSGITQCVLQLRASHSVHNINWLRLQPYQLTQLQNLDIAGGEVALGACHAGGSYNHSNNSSNSQNHSGLTAMTALTRLRLSDMAIGFAAGSLQPLAALTNLQELSLQDVCYTTAAPLSDDANDARHCAPNPWQDDSQGSRYVARLHAIHCGALSAAVACLQQLTSLQIAFHYLGPPVSRAFAPFSSLTNLVDLQLSHPKVADDSLTELRSPGLTKLKLDSNGIHFTRASLPGLVQLSLLQHLTLSQMSEFEPEVLTSFMKLQHLEVEDCDALVPGDREGTSALLAAVAQLQQLTSIHMESVRLAKVDDADYAALVTPPQLQSLRLSSCWPVVVPVTAARHMFRDLTPLNLRTLLLTLVRSHVDQPLGPDETPQQVVERFADCVDQILLCCVGLRDLTIGSSWGLSQMECDQLCIPFNGLLHGAALTRLALGDGSDLAVDEAAIVDVLRHLTQLKHLEIRKARYVTWPSFLQLTALKQLTTLRVHDLRLPDRGYIRSHIQLHLENEAPAGCPSDVDKQLECVCVLHCNLCSAIVQGQQQEQEVREQLQQQIAQKEIELADMTAQLLAAQAQMQLMQRSKQPAAERYS